MFDTHLHTMPFSTDSHMSITELLEKQKETSNGLILTEHIDYDFPPPNIDYICRKAPYEDNELYYSDFPEIIDEILLTLINNNKVIEINTRRFHNKKSIDSLTKIYKRYKTLGGKYVTLGSDAHYANVVSNHFDTAIEMANECDLIPVYFKERKMEII